MKEYLCAERRSWYARSGAHCPRLTAKAFIIGISSRKNIMLRTGSDGVDITKVIDFGIATVCDPESTAPQLTVVSGTARYMAPEQLLGRPSRQSDIYAFGVIAYELVTGRAPFHASGHAELFALQQRGIVVKPKDLRPDLPERAQALILQALSFEQKDRPEDAAAFGESLADALALEDSSLLLPPARIQPPAKRGRGPAIAAGLILLCAMAAVVYWKSFRGPDITTIAVLPFTNQSGNQDLEYVAQGLTDAIVNTLGRLPRLQVRGRTAIPQFRKNQPDARAAGEMFHVGAVLSGSIVEKDGALVVRAELVDTHTAAHLWGETYQRRTSDIAQVQEDICQEVASKLHAADTADERRSLRRRATANQAAEQLYLQGRFFWNRRTTQDNKTATDYFNRAIDLDPNYALPYAGLADVLITQSGSVPPKQVMPQAELDALKAINKDDELAAAHAALASIKLNYEWDWLQAEKEYKRAIELDPSLASAHSWYAVYLWVMERFDEALSESRRAQELEPTSLPIGLGVARSFTMAGRYDEAMRQYGEVLKMFPTSVRPYVEIGLLKERQGRNQEALAQYSKVLKGADVPDDVGLLSTLGHLYPKLGRRAEAQAALSRLHALSRQRYVSPCEMAAVEGALGDREAAFGSLDQCYEDRSWEIIFLKLDTGFAELRSDPRYTAMVRKLRL
jgi:TolB-like protein/Tfp pilus assembly protein PilF